MKRLLITGASGFIGRQIIAPALELGYEVHAVRSSTPVPTERSGAIWHQANLRERLDIEALVARVRPTHIIHAAWVTAHGVYWTSPDNLDWLAAGAHLARAFAVAGGERFVSVGTCAEYAWDGDGHLIEEISVDRPATFYGQIKLAHHQMLMAAAAQFGFEAATGRIFFLFGPGEAPSRVVAHACRALAAGRPAAFSSGFQRRDFLHVSDAGRGLAALLDSSLTGVVNVSSGKARELREVLETLGDISGRPELLRFDPELDRSGDPELVQGNSHKLTNTGWKPRLELREGLIDAYNYWKAQSL